MHRNPSRRRFVAAAGLAPLLLNHARWARAQSRTQNTRPIPASGEALAIIGMGTSETFDVALHDAALPGLADVLRQFFVDGGQLIDSSPMYGNAETVVGALLPKVDAKTRPFIATKVWTDGREAGVEQMRTSFARLGVERLDLMQIHNLRDWRTHLPTLREWKREGRIRYLGITTSHGRDHDALAEIMRSEPLDFVQFSYSIADRRAEAELLPIAADKGIATLVNRPFERGDLFRRTRGLALPDWAADIQCASWGQLFLKYVVGHPAVTCAIPATSKLTHMVDNMGAGFGPLPDAELRTRMEAWFAAL
ncbi:MAG: aldo/keto reductase [Gammaproteobacteria bacterium]